MTQCLSDTHHGSKCVTIRPATWNRSFGKGEVRTLEVPVSTRPGAKTFAVELGHALGPGKGVRDPGCVGVSSVSPLPTSTLMGPNPAPLRSPHPFFLRCFDRPRPSPRFLSGPQTRVDGRDSATFGGDIGDGSSFVLADSRGRNVPMGRPPPETGRVWESGDPTSSFTEIREELPPPFPRV